MPSRKQFTEAEKARILAWREEGHSCKDIAVRLGRSEVGVRKIFRSLRDLPDTATPPPAKKRSGRPRLTTPREDERLRRYVSLHPFKTAKELKREVPGFQNMSVRRLQEVLQKRLDIPSRAAAAKPLLTEKMARKRLRFCRRHLHLTADDWERTMFSDESTFRLINPRAARVRRSKGANRYLSKFTVKTVKHPPSVMVWACFSGIRGRASLYFLPVGQTMNSARYMEVLETKLFPWMELHGCHTFLQDGAPCHKSRASMALLKSKEGQFKVLDWPGNSPDLNPIENVWSIMKARLKRDHDITSLQKLIQAIKMLWVVGMEKELFKKLARSMPARLEAVIRANGQMTKY